jgi:chemotaxis protein histidine kinase CheA
MINLEDELANEYLAECCEHLTTLEEGLLAIEEDGTDADDESINRVFRAVHSVKGGAGFFDLTKIRELAHRIEDVLASMRNSEMVPTSARVHVLLRATDRLSELVHNPGESNQADISQITAALAALLAGDGTSASLDSASETDQEHHVSGNLRTLLVEDDFSCRLVLQSFLSRYGECHIAANGREAVEAYRTAWEQGQRYDFLCMDIMMPVMDGCEAVRHIRAFEESQGVFSTSGAKIIMTTTVHDLREVVRSFMGLCDAYLLKPIDLAKLLGHMKSFQLVSSLTGLPARGGHPTAGANSGPGG